MSRPKGSKNRGTSNSTSIVNKFNARLKAIKKEFGEKFFNKEILSNLQSDINITLTKGGTISAKKSIIDEDTAGYLEQIIPTNQELFNKYKEDIRIKPLIENETSKIKQKAIIGKQIYHMYNVQDSIDDAIKVDFYNDRDEIQVEFTEDGNLIPPEDDYLVDIYKDLDAMLNELKKEKDSIQKAIKAKGIKSYAELDDIQNRIANLREALLEFRMERDAYNDAQNYHIQELAEMEASK